MSAVAMARRGRPEKAPGDRLVPVPMRLEASLFDEICHRLNGSGKPLAAELRRLIRKGMERDG